VVSAKINGNTVDESFITPIIETLLDKVEEKRKLAAVALSFLP